MKIVRSMILVAAAASLLACDDGTPAVTPGTDTGADTVTGTDTGGDTTVADTGADTTVADTTVADTTVADTTVADTTVADTGVDTAVADTGVDTAVEEVVVDCPYVFAEQATRISAASIPAIADLNCDSNGDGTVDILDGELNVALLPNSTIGDMIDINEALQGSIDDGSLVMLPDFVNYTGADGTNITANMLLGGDTQTDPTCNDAPASVCDWAVDPESFDEGCNPVVSVDGCEVSGGELACGPSDFSFGIPLSGLTLDLPITNGTLKGALASGATLTNGRLCGIVPLQGIVDGIAAACAQDPLPDSLTMICAVQGIVPGLLGCDSGNGGDDADLCTIVLGLDGVGTNTLTLGQ